MESFVTTMSDSLSKIGHALSGLKIEVIKNKFNKKCAPKLLFLMGKN